MREEDGISAAEAEARGGDFEIVCGEGRRGGAEGLEEFEDARFGDRWAVLVEEWDGTHESTEDPDGFVEEGGEPGGGFEDLFHKRHTGGVHCVACGRVGQLVLGYQA